MRIGEDAQSGAQSARRPEYAAMSFDFASLPKSNIPSSGACDRIYSALKRLFRSNWQGGCSSRPQDTDTDAAHKSLATTQLLKPAKSVQHQHRPRSIGGTGIGERVQRRGDGLVIPIRQIALGLDRDIFATSSP
jgi:hypothetical protein